MPFEPLDTEPRDVRTPMARIGYERRRSKNSKAGAKPQLIVSIPTTFAGLCKCERFSFDLGTGGDDGKARITGLPKGSAARGAPGTMLKNCVVIRFGHVPALGDDDDSAASEHVKVRKINDNCWEIDLPPWFKVESKVEPKVESPPLAVAAPPTKRKGAA